MKLLEEEAKCQVDAGNSIMNISNGFGGIFAGNSIMHWVIM